MFNLVVTLNTYCVTIQWLTWYWVVRFPNFRVGFSLGTWLGTGLPTGLRFIAFLCELCPWTHLMVHGLIREKSWMAFSCLFINVLSPAGARALSWTPCWVGAARLPPSCCPSDQKPPLIILLVLSTSYRNIDCGMIWFSGCQVECSSLSFSPPWSSTLDLHANSGH